MVSYKSNTFHSSPYVLPVDLGLLSNVLSIKQKSFDTNAGKVQSEIDQMGLLDVMKDEDKKYLNSKINNITSTINNFGGIDFSDQGVTNQIESLGSDVYGDSKVMNAVSSTKSIRNLQNTYEKYKTDPKLNKLYSQVNEAYDMQGVQSYLSTPEVGSKYSGPSSPTPYTAYRDNHLKAFDKIKSDLQTQITDNGLYYSVTNKEYITPERIMSMAADLLTPQEREQMKRDGWYSYRGATPNQLVEKGLEQFNAKKQDAKVLLRQYEAMAEAAVSDPQARKNYNLLAQNQKEIVDSFDSQSSQFTQNLVTRLNKNPEEVYYQLYSSDYFRGLGNRFSVNRTTNDIKPNTAEMFRQKMLQTDQQFSDKMNFDREKFEFDKTKSAEEMALEYAKVGKIRRIDPQTGKVEILDIPGFSQPHLTTDTPNTEDPDDLKITTSKLEEVNTTLKLDNDKISQDFISKIVGRHPELGIEIPSSIGQGTTRQLKGQASLEGFNNTPGFQIEDLQLFERTTDAEGYPTFKNIKEVSQFAAKNHLTYKQLEFLSNQWSNYEAMALGKGNTTPDLVDGFPDAAKRISLNNEKIRANETKIKAVTEQVYKEIGLTPEMIKYMNDRSEDEGDETAAKRAGSNPLIKGDIWDATGIVEWFYKLDNDPIPNALRNAVKQKVNDKLKVLSTRDVYGVRTLAPNEPLMDQLPALISQGFADHNLTEPYGDSNTVELQAISGASGKSIIPRMIGKASDGTGRWIVISDVTAGSGEKQITAKYKTYISDKNASKFGLEADPYEAINYSVKINGRTSDIPVYGNKNLSVFLNVAAENTNNLNDNSAIAQIKVYYLDKNGQKTNIYDTIEIPATQGRTASESFKIAEGIIKQAATQGFNHEQFVEYLRNYKNP